MHRSKRFYHLAIALAAIPLSLLSSAAQACDTDEPSIGSICTFAYPRCPENFVPADGRSLNISQYAALYSLIGTRYGSNAQTFNVPNLSGRVVVGTGQGTGLANVTLGQQFGQQQLTLNATQTPVAPHTHLASFAPTTGPVNVNIPATQGTLAVAASLPVSTATTGAASSLSANQSGYLAAVSVQSGPSLLPVKGPYTTTKPTAPGMATLPADVTINGAPGTAAATATVTTVTGGSVAVSTNTVVPATQPVSTQSPSLGMTVCIAVTGTYPTFP